MADQRFRARFLGRAQLGICCPPPTAPPGLTLVELVIVLTIVGILGSFAGPQFHGLIKGYRLTGAARMVWGDLHRARMMAIKEGRTIRVDFFTSTSYRIVRDETAEVTFSRSLTEAYPGITVGITANSVSFGSTGTAGGGGKTVQIQGPTGSRSFTILTTGRIGTIL